MFLIGATLFLLVVIAIGIPVIRLISRPLNAKYPLVAQLVRGFLWVFVLSIATWPVGVGPLLHKFNCSYLTKFQVEPTIDARLTGYLDDRLSVSEYVATHMDGLFLDKDVDDLVAGRIAFFEMKKIRNGSTGEASSPYLRYSLMEMGSPRCTPAFVGSNSGRGGLATTAPGKCLGAESVSAPLSKYQIRVTGDINLSDGTTKIVERSNGEIVAMFRSFEFSFYGSGSVCPRVDVEGEIYSAHLELTKLVLMDAKGFVKKAIFR